MTHAPGELMQAAAEAARIAAAEAFRHYGPGIAFERKADGSPVTHADREAERVTREWITARFPTHGILGEELGVVRPESTLQWMIDPIDGTRTFVRHVPLWGSLVAVVEGDRVLAGAAVFPAVGEELVAGAGEGCFWNGARCRVSSVARLEDAAVLITSDQFTAAPDRRAGWRRVADAAALIRTWGDCYGYLLVATGRAEVMADPVMSAWDAAAVMVAVEEAGGVFTDWNGRRTAFGGSAVATNGALDEAVRGLLARETARA